jgi:hypothetical protein
MREITLTSHAIEVLKPALHGAINKIKSEIKRGVSRLYITDNNKLYVVLRAEGLELVAVAVAGRGIRESRNEIINFAINNQFKTIRFHTKHPQRLEKGLQGLPLKLIEVRKALLSRDELVYQLNVRGAYHGRI